MTKNSGSSQHKHQHTPQDLRTQRDQDQDDHRLPHCCGVCQDAPGGDQGQGLL